MNKTMQKKAQEFGLWNSFDDKMLPLVGSETLFSGEHDGVEYRVEKPYYTRCTVDANVIDDELTAELVRVQIVQPEDIDTVELATDSEFIEHLQQRFAELGCAVSGDYEDQSFVDRGELLSQGNNYITLEIGENIVKDLLKLKLIDKSQEC